MRRAASAILHARRNQPEGVEAVISEIISGDDATTRLFGFISALLALTVKLSEPAEAFVDVDASLEDVILGMESRHVAGEPLTDF